MKIKNVFCSLNIYVLQLIGDIYCFIITMTRKLENLKVCFSPSYMCSQGIGHIPIDLSIQADGLYIFALYDETNKLGTAKLIK